MRLQAPQARSPRGARHQLVDALRGLALLGIVVVNAEFILQHADLGWSGDATSVDLVVRWLVKTFGELKVYPLFALLFGYGVSVQLDNARESGADLRPRYLRRMAGLLLLGVAHAVLFFPGDILVIYAVVGLIAFLLRQWSTRRLIVLAVAVYAAASAWWFLVAGLFATTGWELEAPPTSDSLRVLTSGGFGDVVSQHLADWPGTLLVLGLIQGPAAFAFVLAGIALGRTDLLTNPTAHRALARLTLVVGGSVGLIGAGLGAFSAIQNSRFAVMGLALGFLAAPALSSAYVAALMLVWERIPDRVSALLRAAGRMSLSVYLLESVVLSTLAYAYGIGLFAQVSPLQGVLIGAGVWGGLSLAAALWLRWARFGPAEWALRSFSYWRFQPLAARRLRTSPRR